MNKSNEQSIKEVIQDLLKTYRLDGRINELKLIGSWEKVMGKTIAKHTTDIYIKKKQLFVKLDSAALRQELSYAREKILKMMNDEAGIKVIDEIIFS
jgi:predicted nucleic acid-binding Zn ribbon protein